MDSEFIVEIIFTQFSLHEPAVTLVYKICLQICHRLRQQVNRLVDIMLVNFFFKNFVGERLFIPFPEGFVLFHNSKKIFNVKFGSLKLDCLSAQREKSWNILFSDFIWSKIGYLVDP